MNKIGIIIIGGHVQGLGLIRICAINNIPVILFDSNKINIARHSKYCSGFIKYSNLIKDLEKLGKLGKYKKWIIIPTKDEHVFLLSKNKNELSRYFTIPVPNWDIIKYTYNKKLTYNCANENNVDIPTTFFPENQEQLEDIPLEFPCIIKPAIMHKFYSAVKKKVFICKNKHELISNYSKAAEIIPADEILIQDIIPGSSINQYSACFYFNKEPLISMVARRKRQHPIDFGNATTYAETVQDQSLIDISVKLLKAINYYGICEVEFKLDPRDNKYKLLEINPRTWKWHYISELSSSPFLLSLYNDLIYGKPIIKNTWDKATWQDIVTDLFSYLKMKIKGIQSGKFRDKEAIQAIYDKEDIWPFIYQILYLPYFIITR